MTKKPMPVHQAEKAKYDLSEEIAENVAIDFDNNGRIIGIEVLVPPRTLETI